MQVSSFERILMMNIAIVADSVLLEPACGMVSCTMFSRCKSSLKLVLSILIIKMIKVSDWCLEYIIQLMGITIIDIDCTRLTPLKLPSIMNKSDDSKCQRLPLKLQGYLITGLSTTTKSQALAVLIVPLLVLCQLFYHMYYVLHLHRKSAHYVKML